ncbi:MAG: hypothetical protein ACXVAB_13445 [Thermodesulfobacteriota bacterium]
MSAHITMLISKIDYPKEDRWWNENEEIGLVALSRDKPDFAAQNKWSKKPDGIDILKELRRKASLISSERLRDDLRLGLFSRSGFTKEITDLGRKGEIQLIDVRKIGL